MSDAASDWHPLSAESLADPAGTDRRMREACPVAYTEDGGGFYAFFKNADIQRAVRERETFVSSPTHCVPKMAEGAPPWVPLQADLPEHRLFRRVLMPFFAQNRIAAFEPALRQVTNELIDRFICRGEADIARELCLAVPALAICMLLGLPEQDSEQLLEWTETSIHAMATGDIPRKQEIDQQMAKYGLAQLELRRAEPRDDALTAMLTADIGGRPMTEAELEGMFLLLGKAGHETTANALGTTIRYLADHPNVRRRMRDDPEALEAGIEEFLRHASPVRALARTTTRDVEVGGRVIPAGSQVALMFNSGSHDEEVFPDPDVCDFSRDTSAHLAFGRGIHRCLGEHLARLEMRVVLTEFLRRIPDFELSGEPSIALWPTTGYMSLPIRFPVGESAS